MSSTDINPVLDMAQRVRNYLECEECRASSTDMADDVQSSVFGKTVGLNSPKRPSVTCSYSPSHLLHQGGLITLPSFFPENESRSPATLPSPLHHSRVNIPDSVPLQNLGPSVGGLRTYTFARGVRPHVQSFVMGVPSLLVFVLGDSAGGRGAHP